MATYSLTAISGTPLANTTLSGQVAGASIATTLSGAPGFTVGVLSAAPPTNVTVTLTAGDALSGGGTFTTNQGSDSTITINHEDTSTATSISGLTGAAVLSEVSVDAYGHTTGLNQRNLTLSDLGYTGATDADNYASWTINDGTTSEAIASGDTLNVSASAPLAATYTAGTNTLAFSSTAISNVSEDASPQLSANLDLNSNNITGTGDISTTGDITATNGVISDGKGDVRLIPQNSQTAAYTLVAADAGKHISITTGGVTVPASVFSVGDLVTIYNNSGVDQTISKGTTTLRFASDGTNADRTLGGYGVCNILCVGTDTFVISGAGLS